MDGILNETTNTVHRPEAGTAGQETVCGVTYHVPADNFRPTEFDPDATPAAITKCGRCFDDAGGY